MNRFVHIVSRLAFVLASAAGLVACGDGEATFYLDGGARSGAIVCADGQIGTTPACTAALRCTAGYTAGFVCNAERTGYTTACACQVNGTGTDAGVTPVPTCTGQVQSCGGCPAGQTGTQICSGTTWGNCICSGGPTTCTNGVTQGCAGCPSGQTGTQTCSGNAWGVCVCSGNGATSCSNGTTQNCAGCAAGQTGNQTCNGNAWGVCICSGTSTTCTNGVTQACAGCPSGQTGNQTCNGSAWGICVCSAGPSATCVDGATLACTGCPVGQSGIQTCSGNAWGTCVCSSASGSVCPRGELVNVACTPVNGIACSAGQYTARTCNFDGSVLNNDCRCLGGTASADRTMRVAIDAYAWHFNEVGNANSGVWCAQDTVNLVYFDGLGDPARTPRSVDRTMAVRPFKRGIVHFEVVCGTSPDAPRHPQLVTNAFVGHRLRDHAVTIASVTGTSTTERMRDQINGSLPAIFCGVTNSGTVSVHNQGAVAVNDEMVGRCVP